MNLDDALMLFVVYDHPRDYPDAVVVRQYAIGPGGQVDLGIVAREPTLDGARRALIAQWPWLAHLPRDPEDDPVIVESWV